MGVSRRGARGEKTLEPFVVEVGVSLNQGMVNVLFFGILNITFKYFLEIISPIVG